MLSEADFNKFMTELKNAANAVAAISRTRYGGFLFFRRNANSLRKEIAKLNLQIKEGARQQNEKLSLLYHDGIIDEANVLRSALQSALTLLPADFDTRTKQYLQVAIGWLKTFESTVNKHRILVERNAPLSETDEMEKIMLYKYEQHKERLLMAIDDVIGKEDVLSANVVPDVGRRRILTYAAAGLVAAFTGNMAYGQETAQKGVAKVAFEPGKGNISEDDIAKLMKYETVEELLKEKDILPVAIEFVQYNQMTGVSNYDSLVFQKDLKPEQRKPVIAMTYKNKDPPGLQGDSVGVGHRSAILLKLLASKFSDFRIVAYDIDSDLTLSRDNYAGFFQKYGLKRSPSFAIYGLLDVTKPESSKNEVILVDIVNGGPKSIKTVFEIFKGISEYGISTNITAPNGKYVWRLNNSSPWKWEKIEYGQ